MRIIENEYLRVSVSDMGAELTSVKDQNNAERIWTGDPAVWNRHAPILFPFVGKVTEGAYRIGGREYPMKTQHGFARDLEFECVQETPSAVTHQLAASPWTLDRYPYDFLLTVRHRLEEKRLIVEWAVENRSAEPMYFSIGGHPGFLLPQGIRKEDCGILFPGKEALRYIQVNKAGFALPEEKTLTPRNGCVPYQADIPDTWIFQDGQVKQVGISLPDGTPWVMLHCEEFPLLAVWANPNGPFICLEPWFGRTDDQGFGGDISEKKDVQKIGSGERKEISYWIEFC